MNALAVCFLAFLAFMWVTRIGADLPPPPPAPEVILWIDPPPAPLIIEVGFPPPMPTRNPKR